MKSLILAVTVGIVLVSGMPEAHAAARVLVTKTIVVVRPTVRAIPARSSAVRVVTRDVRQSLRRDHVRVVYGDRIYYLVDGVYYVNGPRGYRVTSPVSGVQINSIPRGYVTVRQNGKVTYRYNGISYRKGNGFYVVV